METTYRQRLTDYLRSMPRGTKVETAKIVKPENMAVFREEFLSICSEHWNEFGHEFTCDEALTYIRRYDEWVLKPISAGTLAVNGKVVGTLKDFCDGKLKGCFDELFKK